MTTSLIMTAVTTLCYTYVRFFTILFATFLYYTLLHFDTLFLLTYSGDTEKKIIGLIN